MDETANLDVKLVIKLKCYLLINKIKWLMVKQNTLSYTVKLIATKGMLVVSQWLVGLTVDWHPNEILVRFLTESKKINCSAANRK